MHCRAKWRGELFLPPNSRRGTACVGSEEARHRPSATCRTSLRPVLGHRSASVSKLTLRSMTYFEPSRPDHTFSPLSQEKPNESRMERWLGTERRTGRFGDS